MLQNPAARPWMLLVLLGLGLADYALASSPWCAGGFTLLQAVVLPVLGVVLWRRLKVRSLGGPLLVCVAALAALSLVLLARLEVLLAGDAAGRVAAYRTFVVIGGVIQSVALLLQGDPLERVLRLVANHQARLMASSFGLLALIGALLLTLPQSVRDLGQVSFVDALFTATSALCVTGLTVNVVGETYTPMGQAVILGLMETGGVGIMVLYSFFAVLTGQRLRLRRAVVMAEMIDTRSLASLRRTLVGIVALALSVQAVGALALYFALLRHGPEPSGTSNLWWNAAFHAASAYCNAGITLYPANLVPFARSWSVLVVVMTLIVVGGLGFPVGFELLGRTWQRLCGRRPVRMSLHTRTVLWTTALLLVGGAVTFLLLEWRGSMRHLGLGTRLLASLFQSATARTAGFNTLDFVAVAPSTLVAVCILMFIGASPGSTGGGIKTTTFAVLLATFRAELRHRKQTCLMGRAVPAALQRRALGVGLLGLVAVLCGVFLLLVFERQEPLRLMFEVVSALSTTGLSTGITPELSAPGKLLLVVGMLAGRVGPLTVALAFAEAPDSNRSALPEERLGIG
ncbi:MAG: TrkH family potassium uptake protein [Polyangiaceae bacterium]|nr:TrkH family potassium uptake protein [Polyangiaceae bacterium]